MGVMDLLGVLGVGAGATSTLASTGFSISLLISTSSSSGSEEDLIGDRWLLLDGLVLVLLTLDGF